MSLEEHIKTSKELYENVQRKLEEQKIHREESIKRENKLRREREQRDKEYEIRRLENKNYAVFKGNQTRLLGIGRLFAESFIAQLGDFEYSEYMSHQTYGSADVAHTLSVIFSYKGIETKHHPFWSYENRSSYYYFPDWDLTIPAKLIKDAQKLTRLNNKNRTG